MYEWDLDGHPVARTWLIVRQAWEALERAMEWELEMHKATLPQIDILALLRMSKEPLTPTQIANLLFRAEHSTSGLLMRMEDAGYIVKTKAGTDRRKVQVRATAKGEELFDRAAGGGFLYAHRTVSDTLTIEEMEQLHRILKALRDGALREMGLSPLPLPACIDPSLMFRKRRGSPSSQ